MTPYSPGPRYGAQLLGALPPQARKRLAEDAASRRGAEVHVSFELGRLSAMGAGVDDWSARTAWALLSGGLALTAPLRLAGAIPASHVQRVPLMHNARIVLSTLAARQPVAPGEVEDLPPPLVRSVRRRMRWPAEFPPWYQDIRGTAYEAGARLLQLRALLALAGLIRRDDDGFRTTPRAQWLLHRTRAGLLYRVLARTALRNVTLITFTPTEATYYLQAIAPAALDILRRLDDRWHPVSRLRYRLGLPELRTQALSHIPVATLHGTVQFGLFDILRSLGLLDRRDLTHHNERWVRSPLKPSPLLRRFVTVDTERLAARERQVLANRSRRAPAFQRPAPPRRAPITPAASGPPSRRPRLRLE